MRTAKAHRVLSSVMQVKHGFHGLSDVDLLAPLILRHAGACLTLRSELLDFVCRYPASRHSERNLGSFLSEVSQMLYLGSILLRGPYTLGFFESQSGFFQSNRGAPDDCGISPSSIVGASRALQGRVMHRASA